MSLSLPCVAVWLQTINRMPDPDCIPAKNLMLIFTFPEGQCTQLSLLMVIFSFSEGQRAQLSLLIPCVAADHQSDA